MDAVTSQAIKHYFDLLEKTLKDNNVLNKPAQIYNVDETGMAYEHCASNVKCTTFTPQIKGNNRAIYLILPLHQGIIMILPGKVAPLNSDLLSDIQTEVDYTLYIYTSIRYRLWVLVLKFRQVSSRHF